MNRLCANTLSNFFVLFFFYLVIGVCKSQRFGLAEGMIHLLVSAPPRHHSVISGCRRGEPGVIHPGLGSAARGVMTIGGSGFFLIYLWYGRKRWVY